MRRATLRRYASAFSRRVLTDVEKYGDCRGIDEALGEAQLGEIRTYREAMRYMYEAMRRGYQNEYVYKNELLIPLLGFSQVVISEFRVGRSIADLVAFGDYSTAYEIKTGMDGPQRLPTQLADYRRLFQQVYLVVPRGDLARYERETAAKVGLLAMDFPREHPDSYWCGEFSVPLKMVRAARPSDEVDHRMLIRSVRTDEYKAMVKEHFGELPPVGGFHMFSACEELLGEIPQPELIQLFRNTMRRRELNTLDLVCIPRELRQAALAMRWRWKSMEKVLHTLEKPVRERVL